MFLQVTGGEREGTGKGREAGRLKVVVFSKWKGGGKNTRFFHDKLLKNKTIHDVWPAGLLTFAVCGHYQEAGSGLLFPPLVFSSL